MDEETILLGSILKNIDNFDVSTFKGRLTLQKTIYLMQAFDLYIGYNFKWYLRGPFSPQLARQGFELEKIYNIVPTSLFKKTLQKRFKEFLSFISDKKNNPNRLEILASIHFLYKVYPDMKKINILTRVKNKQKHFTMKQCETAWNELEKVKLI